MIPDYRKMLPALFRPASGPARVNLKKTAQKTARAMEELRALSSGFVMGNVEKYRALSQKAQKSAAGDGRTALARLKKLRDFFQDLERKKRGVQKQALAALAEMEDMERGIQKALRVERNHHDHLSAEADKLAGAPPGGGRAVRENALAIRKKLTTGRIGMLEEFARDLSPARPAALNLVRGMDRFLLMVEENARVFDEACHTLALKQDLEAGRAATGFFAAFEDIADEVKASQERLSEAQTRLMARAGKTGRLP